MALVWLPLGSAFCGGVAPEWWGEYALAAYDCYLPSALVGPLPRRSRILACLVLAGVVMRFLADGPWVSLLVDCLPHVPVEMENWTLSVPPNTPHDILIAPVLPTAGACSRRELGFLRLAGLCKRSSPFRILVIRVRFLSLYTLK